MFWLFFAVTFAIYLIMVLWSLPKLAAMAGGEPAFDLRPFGYDFEQARTFVSAIGLDGRDFYLTVQHSLDTAYPALLVITVVMALIGLDRGGWGWIFAVFSISGTIFDYLENMSVRKMLEAGPVGLTPELVEQASSWTFLKSISHSIAFTGLLILFLISMYARFRERRGNDNKAVPANNPQRKADK